MIFADLMTNKYYFLPRGDNLSCSSFGPFLLAVGLFLTVCGTLRVSDGVGIGEILLLVLAVVGWVKGPRAILISSPFAWFWCMLAVLMGLGYAFNDLIGNWVRRDTVAYLYTGAVSLGVLLWLRGWSDYQLKIFWRILLLVSLTILWFGFVVYISGDIDWIRSLRMDDQGDTRYTAWSTNANQLALFFVPLPIWLLLLRPSVGARARFAGWLFVMFITLLMGLIVRSDALVLSWALGFLLLVMLDAAWKNRLEMKLLLIVAIMAVGVLLVAKTFASGDVRKTFVCSLNAIQKFESPIANACIPTAALSGLEGMRTGYDSPENKTAIRIGLWKNALTVIADAPLIGHGPGAFSWYADPALQKKQQAIGKIREEAHNIPLDLMTQGGVLLGLAWLGLLTWLIVIAYQARVAYAFVWVFMLGFFTLFMYHLRHPYLWVSLILAQEVVRRGLWSLKPKADSGASA